MRRQGGGHMAATGTGLTEATYHYTEVEGARASFNFTGGLCADRR
jgi:hypothetical protein